MYTPVPGFEELQAEFHAALDNLAAGKPDRSDILIPLSRAIAWEEDMGRPQQFTMREVCKAVVLQSNHSWEEVMGARRFRSVARVRQMCMYLMSQLCPHASLHQIAQQIGGRDHSTAMHAVRRVEELLATDAEYREFYHACLYRLGLAAE